MPEIKIINGPMKDKTFPVGKEPLVVGREPTCAIQILDKGASRQHAEIFRIGEMCFIRDLDSRNGIVVNNERVKEEMLRDGDQIQIGATLLTYVATSEGAVNFADDEAYAGTDSMSTLELKLEDLNDPTAFGDGADARRLRALYRLGRMIGNVADEKELINKVLPFACEQLGAELAYLFIRNPDTGSIAPIGSYFTDKAESGKISRSIIKRAIIDKRAILTSDAMNDGRFKAQESIVIKGIRSVICSPLSVSGAISGVLYLSNDALGKTFTDDELELSAAMADQIGLAIANFRVRSRLRESMTSTIKALVRAVEMHDPSTRGKSERVARYAAAIAQNLNFSAEMQQNIQMAGLLHDVGVLAESDLARFGRAGAGEGAARAAALAARARATLEIIKGIDSYAQLEKTIRYMYERADGSGPEGVTDIPPSARVLGLAIDFDELANPACPTGEWPPEKEKENWREAIAEVGRQAGRRYDEAAVRALIVAHREGLLQPK